MTTKTNKLLSKLIGIDNDDYLDQFIDELYTNSECSTIYDYLELLISEKNLKKSEVIQDSGIERSYAYQIFNSTRKPGRDKILALALTMKLSLYETNKALTINGNNILYSKNIRDAIIIYCINTKKSVLDTNYILKEKEVDVLN